MRNARVMLHGLVREPLFTLIAIVSLALGIGANTAVFSLFDQVLLRALPVQNPGDLVYFYSPGPRYGNVSGDEDGAPEFNYPTFQAFQQEQTVFSGLAGAFSIRATLACKNEARYGDARLVSGNYFDVLGCAPPWDVFSRRTTTGLRAAARWRCWATRIGWLISAQTFRS